MDQLRTFFAQVQKYHFWILCVLVVIVGLTSWYLSTSNLQKVTKANAEEIKKKNKEVLAISSIAPHPNDVFLTGMDKIIHQHAMSIGVGWQKRYAQQEKLLVWPKILTQELIREVDPLRPIEMVPYPTPAAQEINPENREIYRNFITLELPKLAETIGATWYAKVGEGTTSGGSSGGMSMSRPSGGSGGMRPPGGGGMGIRPPGGSSGGMRPSGGSSMGGIRPGGSSSRIGESAEDIDKSIVKWDPANQQEILNEHFGFASRGVEPSTLEVLYAQEDFWVLQAIMNIIKRTNGDADAYYNVPIKDIQSVQIGRTVVGRMGLVSPIFQQSGSGAAGGLPGGMSPSQGMAPAGGGMVPPAGGAPPAVGGPTGSSGAPGMPGAAGAADLLDPALGRYVDVDYNPLPPADLRAALTSKDSKLAVYAVAKRMPVRLRFKMDQRRLSDLLAECGNSSLPVEVRQVRINCPAGLASSSGTASSGGSMLPMSGSGGAAFKSGGMSSSSSSSRLGGGSSSGGALSSMGGGNKAAEVDPNEAEIEVYGIVHIFNPVNQKQLGIELRENAGDQSPVESDDAAARSDPTALVPATAPARG